MWRSSSPTRKRIRARYGRQSRATPTSDLTTPISISKRDLVTWKKADIGFIRVRFFLKDRPHPAPETAHTDARIDAKLSHVQHSSTDKHGPSRDQAGTRRCVPHVAPRPEPVARHRFFSREPRGIFFRRDATRSARRDPRFRVSPRRRTSASVTCVSYPDGPSVRAVSGARCRPLPAGSTLSTRQANLPTHAALFWFFFFFARAKRCALRHSVSISSRRLWRLAGLGRARHSRRRRRTPRALASLLRQPLQRQPPQLDRRARPSQIHRPPQPRRRRGRHPRPRRSAFALSGERR